MLLVQAWLLTSLQKEGEFEKQVSMNPRERLFLVSPTL